MENDREIEQYVDKDAFDAISESVIKTRTTGFYMDSAPKPDADLTTLDIAEYEKYVRLAVG